MGKKTYKDTDVIGADAPEKQSIDAESAPVDTGNDEKGKAAEILAGMNPGSGGNYRLVDGKIVRE